jgi:hypothetical protein
MIDETSKSLVAVEIQAAEIQAAEIQNETK